MRKKVDPLPEPRADRFSFDHQKTGKSFFPNIQYGGSQETLLGSFSTFMSDGGIAVGFPDPFFVFTSASETA